MKAAKGRALMNETSHKTAMMRNARLRPDMAYEWSGWQMARYLSMENATMVSTDVYDVLQHRGNTLNCPVTYATLVTYN